MSIENLPPELIDKYEVHEYRHAIAILNVDFPEEYNEVVEMLSAFTLKKSAIIAPGGRKIPIYIKRGGVKKCLKHNLSLMRKNMTLLHTK